MRNKTCKLCQKHVSDEELMYFSGGHICQECGIEIIKIMEIKNNSPASTKSNRMDSMPVHRFRGNDGEKDMRPCTVSGQLSEYVVGQEHAKKILSVAAYNHYKRIQLRDQSLQKSNVLLVGPTGSGKTYLVKTLAKILDVPLAIVPATNLTETGYVGKDVDSIVQNLYDMSGCDAAKTERGIIFIDEIDKLAGHHAGKREVGATGVQQSLLPIIEGCNVEVSVNSDQFGAVKMGEARRITIDTTNILFICGGAFPEVEEIIKKRMGKTVSTGIGFQASVDENKKADTTDVLENVTVDDLKEFGMIPELLGRLPVIASLKNLNIETLKRILCEPKDSLVSQYKKYFQFDGIELEFSEEALTAIAEKAYDVGTGARSLRTITENLLTDLMYYTPSQENVKKIIITKEFVENKGNPEFIMDDMQYAFGN